MTSSGWPPYDAGQSKPEPWAPTPWSPAPAPGAANAGPWHAGPAQPMPSYPPAGGYGQPGTASGAPRAYRAPSATGIAVASVGAALAVLGLFLSWYARGADHAGVKELVQAAKVDGAPGLAHLYFGWALWVVLAVAIAAAISANLAGSSVAPLAVGGAVVGVLSTVLTYAALNAGRTSGSPLDNAAAGLWLFLLGPLILAAGALFAFARPAR